MKDDGVNFFSQYKREAKMSQMYEHWYLCLWQDSEPWYTQRLQKSRPMVSSSLPYTLPTQLHQGSDVNHEAPPPIWEH